VNTVGVSGYIGLSFEASGADADLLEAFFLIHSTLAGVEEKNDGSLLYYIPFPEWTEAFQEWLEAFCTEHSEIEFLGSEEIEDHDWNAEWEATIVPQRATTELVITPSWKSKEAFEMRAKYTITIDPKMSFGTGHHETTRLCMKAIEEMNLAGKRALDLGTGSGVLAMYALMRGAKHAVGIDTDSWSITNALENRALNNISESQFEIRQGTLGTAAKESESFDLILANLHRNILIENARLLRKHMAPSAWLVLSGILMYDVAEIRAAFESERFTFSKELRENEWSCLIFQASK
jgi:ribosomal protein L11 methyltransferase